jgi:PIN domain nuclease of toxin-antitoxin system
VFVLDTHVWIWTLERPTGRIGRGTRRSIDRWAAQDALRVSSVSVFEVGALHSAGRLRLSFPLEQWIRAALEPMGIRLAPLSLDAAVDAGTIGRDVLPDPLDRLITATARQMGATLVTRDSGMLEYAEGSGSLRVLNAAR